MAEELDAFGRPIDGESVRVALLLPLTGRGDEVGTALLNASQMAMFDAGGDNFELMPMDTQGNPERAAEAAQQAIADGADLILGPLFGDEVSGVRRAAQSAGINVIAFTTDSSQAGNNVFVMGLLPEGQVERVVSFGVEQGLDRFALLAPDNRYSRIVADAMSDTASSQGGSLARTVYYDERSPNLESALDQLLVGGNPDFDALMVPTSGEQLQAVVQLVADSPAGDSQILGTGLWDEQSTYQIQSLHGSWFGAPNPNYRADFEGRYRNEFGQTPPRIATLAYDAVALAAILSRQGGDNPYGTETLTDRAGFAGLDGLFRFNQNGTVERGLAVLEVTPNGPRVIGDPPASFVGGPAF